MGLMDNIKNAQEMAAQAQQQAAEGQQGAPAVPGAPGPEEMAEAAALARISQNGTEAPATIQSTTPTGKTNAGGGVQHAITAEVRPAGADAYTATFNQYLMEVQMPWAQPGTNVTVKIDPEDPNTMVLWGEG